MKPDENTAKVWFEIVDRLQAAGVDFIVAGGQAGTFYGAPPATFETDLCYRRTPKNIERLTAALKDFNPTLRGAPKELRVPLDAQMFTIGTNFTLDTNTGPLDLLGHLEPVGGYDEILPSSQQFDIGGRIVSVISIEDLIRIKQFIKRPKDQESLLELRRIQKIRGKG